MCGGEDVVWGGEGVERYVRMCGGEDGKVRCEGDSLHPL